MRLRLTVGRWMMPVGERGEKRAVKGDIIDVAESVGAWLLKSDAAELVEDDATADTEDSEPVDVAEEVTPAELVEDDATADTEDTRSAMKKPVKLAPVEDWRKYAASFGIDTKGLTKPQLIAAVAKIS